MNKVLNFFSFPILIIGLIALSNGTLSYINIFEYKQESNIHSSNQINRLYSEKEITLKDPPISEKLTNKLFVKVRVKPINPKIISKIENRIDLNDFTNLSDTDFNHLEPSKKQFVQTVLPIIINENQNILITRNFIIDLKTKLETFKTLKNEEVGRLNKIASKYNINFSNKHKLDLVEEILENVDIIPNSIVLAQAAIESGWGKSRFATEYNALFGEYTYDQNKGVVPLNREFGDKHFIKSFNSYDGSVSSYFKNINSHNAYKDFRAVRNVMRNKNNFSNINLLIKNLDSYAEDINYINTLAAVIKKNDFNQFDLKVISY